MPEIDIFLAYLSNSGLITIFVLSWLSIYFIITFTILFSRISFLNSWKSKEQRSLEDLLLGKKINATQSILRNYANGDFIKEKFKVCINASEKTSTGGLTWLSIIASTSPFIGLFGTVVSILDTFSKLGDSSSASINVIAPAISEALVATGCGIFVAIPAYTFHLIIKRKSYELISIIKRSSEISLLSLSNNNASNDSLEEE